MPLVINYKNIESGNKATASVLLLYYHLLCEGGFTHDQCVYLDPKWFDGFTYLDVEVSRNEDYILDIDERLLREGAVIYLLSELNDMLSDFNHPLEESYTRKILASCQEGKFRSIPEAEKILTYIRVDGIEYEAFSKLLAQIYEKYVKGRFLELLSG